MFNFGIPGYTPKRLEGKAAIVADHDARLRALSGRRLDGVWLAWDLDDDEWFADCPVVLDFEGERLEVTHSKLSDLSITWNSIDPAAPIQWPGSEDTYTFHLAWRRDPLPALAELRGQKLETVELLEWTGHDLANGTVAMGFSFVSKAYATIYNALDENGIEFGTPRREYRRLSPDGSRRA